MYDQNRKVIKSVKAPKQISGYEYEVVSSLNAIERGQIECWEMPHAETLRIMQIMDDLRNAWGIIYPFEQADTSNTEMTIVSEIDTAVVEEVIAAEAEYVSVDEQFEESQDAAIESVAAEQSVAVIQEDAFTTEDTDQHIFDAEIVKEEMTQE